MMNIKDLNKNFGTIFKSFKKYEGFSAFTLAEMMVVLLIVSIILACLAPAVTTKMKADQNNLQTSPWKWVQQGTGRNLDAYFGIGNNQIAHIGQNQRGDSDNAKLVINNSNFSNMIAFKNGDIRLGSLAFGAQNGILLGSLSGDDAVIRDTVSIGQSLTQSRASVTIGYNAQTNGAESVAIGYNSSGVVANGSGAVAVGSEAHSGDQSIAVGKSAQTTGTQSVAIGYSINTNNNYTVAIGSSSSVSGDEAVAIGNNATATTNAVAIGGSTSDGYGNSAVTASGTNSIAIGSYATATGNKSIAIGGSSYVREGYNTFGSNVASSGESSVAVGDSIKVTGKYSIGIGVGKSMDATYDPITIPGDYAVAIGSAGLTARDKSVAIGYDAKTHQNFDIAIGFSAMGNNTAEVAGVNGNNIAIGTRALYSGKSTSDQAHADHNIAIGQNALYSNTTGTSNIAIGQNALYSNPIGSYNVAIGEYALYKVNNNNNNTAVGYGACRYVKGSNKTCIGANSGPDEDHPWASYATDNVERIFIGSKSKFNGGPAVLEVHNDPAYKKYDDNFSPRVTSVVINGHLIVKGNIITTGAKATDEHYSGEQNGNRITAIGVSKDSELRKANINNQDSAFFRYFSDADGKNGKFLAEDPDTISGTGKSSDRRLKYVGKENNDGLAKLRQIKVFNYTFKKDPQKTPRVGVMAQDLQKIFPHAVKKGADGFLTIRMEDMFYAVINAIKELDTRVSKLEKENQLLKEQNKALDARLRALEKRL